MRTRRASAEASRTKILEAARALIGGSGDLADFSMEAVARRAGVARMTVYNRFRSRSRLLDALADHLAGIGGLSRIREVFMEPDPPAALHRFIAIFVDFWASDRATLRRLRAMGVVFPTHARRPRERDAWRAEAAARLVARLRPSGRSGESPSQDDLTALLVVLTGFETFDALCQGSRSPEDVTELLTVAADRALLP